MLQKVSLLFFFKLTNFLGRIKSSYFTDVAAGLTSAGSPLSVRLVPGGAGCDNIRTMSRHV